MVMFARTMYYRFVHFVPTSSYFLHLQTLCQCLVLVVYYEQFPSSPLTIQIRKQMQTSVEKTKQEKNTIVASERLFIYEPMHICIQANKQQFVCFCVLCECHYLCHFCLWSFVYTKGNNKTIKGAFQSKHLPSCSLGPKETCVQGFPTDPIFPPANPTTVVNFCKKQQQRNRNVLA